MTTRTCSVISVDADLKTMVVHFDEDGETLDLNIPVPTGSQTTDSVVQAFWPSSEFARRADAGAQVAAAAAAIGQVMTVASFPSPPRYLDKLTIVDRLNVAGRLQAALDAMAADSVLKARWDAATRIDTTDDAVTAFLTAIGADTAAILAP